MSTRAFSTLGLLLYAEDGSNIFLRIKDNDVSSHMASYIRR
jgi:hypothetical protein